MNNLHPFFGRRTLVTGARGFIGGHLCRELCRQGAEVHAISRAPQSDNEIGPRWWNSDLGQIESVRRVIAAVQPEVIFHLASYVSGTRGLNAVLPAFHDNLLSTVNILTAATEIGCGRVVLAGSLEEPDANEATAVPSSPYAAAKFAASIYARMFAELYQTPVVVARLFMVYGPAQRDLTKLVPYVTLSFLKGEAPRLMSGERPVDWVFVDDVVAGLLALGSTSDLVGRTIDIGSGQLVRVRDVVEQLRHRVGSDVEPTFGALSDRARERVRVADSHGTFSQLSWRPAVSLDEGLRRTVEWYRQSLPDALSD